MAGQLSFRTDRLFRYRGKLVLESRRRASKKWLLLAYGRVRQRGKPDSRGRASARVPAVVSLRGLAGRRVARGDSFRASAVQRVQIDGGLLERTEIRNRGVRLKQCELGLGSRFVERRLTSALRPPGGGKASGTATISRRDRRRPVLSVRARLPRLPQSEVYEVWVYDDKANAISLGAPTPGSKGVFAGKGAVPKGYRDYAFVDISREKNDLDTRHSGRSVLRGPLPVSR